MNATSSNSNGPKYHIDIEGTVYPWNDDTITVPQLRELGGLPAGVPVVEVNLQDGTERELAETEVVTVKPGMGYSKKVLFKRG